MPRKSKNDLSVVSVAELARPEPPKDLHPDASAIWKTTVNALPSDWFRPETHVQLASYCRHMAEEQEISRQIEHYKCTAENFDTKEYDTLLRMQERESRAAFSYATRLRLTPQSTYDPKKPKGAVQKAPWESGNQAQG